MLIIVIVLVDSKTYLIHCISIIDHFILPFAIILYSFSNTSYILVWCKWIKCSALCINYPALLYIKSNKTLGAVFISLSHSIIAVCECKVTWEDTMKNATFICSSPTFLPWVTVVWIVVINIWNIMSFFSFLSFLYWGKIKSTTPAQVYLYCFVLLYKKNKT